MPAYPDTPMLNADIRYKRATVDAVRAFAEAGPWTGSIAIRKAKFAKLCADLKVIYNRPNLTLLCDISRPYSDSGDSCFVPAMDTIIMRGRFSVVTFLHESAHALGKDEFKATEWSVNLFAKVFPEKMAVLKHHGHVLRSR